MIESAHAIVQCLSPRYTQPGGGEVCPICCEVKADVAALDHWRMPGEKAGDVSAHKMCSECLATWGKNECPFCRETLIKDEIVAFISDFTQSVQSSASDANASAALLERLQCFEMEHEGQPAVLKRVYSMIATDPTLCAQLDAALKARATWPRDMAGILLRLDAMASTHELRNVTGAHTTRLRRVAELIWSQFDDPLAHDPHYWGAFYTQIVGTWLCAWRSGVVVDGLAESVRRAGVALVCMDGARGGNADTRRRVRERLHEEYVTVASTGVWGSLEEDVVYCTFYKDRR